MIPLSILDPDDSALMDWVLESIGGIHVFIGGDNAGRWRIKRAPNERL